MHILYFAQARLAVGVSEDSLHSPEPLTQDKFWHLLTCRHPALLPLQTFCRLSKNCHFLQTGQMIDPDDEVAILPPVSGG